MTALHSPARDTASADAFARALYEHHGSVLLRFAAGLLGGDWHRAEDVLQEAAIRAWQHAAELGPATGALRPWLFQVVRNLVIDGYQSFQAGGGGTARLRGRCGVLLRACRTLPSRGRGEWSTRVSPASSSSRA